MAIQTVKATINGQEYDLTYSSGTGKWTATITAPNKSSYNQPNHYYDVTLKATDDAGNTVTKDSTDTTLGDSLKLYVKEKVAPTQSITYPTANALITNNKPTITWEVRDDDSGVDPDSIKLTIDSNAAITTGITKTPVSGGYDCSYTPSTTLADGQHTIKVDASDHDGNASIQTSISFKIDTVAPILNVTSPTENFITNQSQITVEGTTNDVTSSPVTVTINDEPVTVQSNGSFSKQITLSEGENTITVVATDGAGKSTTVTRHVTLDTGGPVFKSVTITPNPVDGGQTFIIEVEVEDD